MRRLGTGLGVTASERVRVRGVQWVDGFRCPLASFSRDDGLRTFSLSARNAASLDGIGLGLILGILGMPLADAARRRFELGLTESFGAGFGARALLPTLSDDS